MNIKDKLQALMDFFIRQRRSGTTTLIKDIESKHKVWVLVYDQHEKKEYINGITIHELDKKVGIEKRPILMETNVIMKLIEESAVHIAIKESQLKDRDEVLSVLEIIIQRFKSKNNIE